MNQEHHRNGNGRYYKDDPNRRSKKYYPFHNNYNSYSSYSSNPNPFPQPANTTNIPSKSSPFSSRRSEPNTNNPSSTIPVNHSRSIPNRNEWYGNNTPVSRRTPGYRGNRPLIPGNTTNSPINNRRSVSGSYKDELANNQNIGRYPDYNSYMDPYYNDHYSIHKKSGFKPKYNTNFGYANKHPNEYRDYSNQKGYAPINNRSQSSNTIPTSSFSLDSKDPNIDISNNDNLEQNTQLNQDTNNHEVTENLDSHENKEVDEIDQDVTIIDNKVQDETIGDSVEIRKTDSIENQIEVLNSNNKEPEDNEIAADSDYTPSMTISSDQHHIKNENLDELDKKIIQNDNDISNNKLDEVNIPLIQNEETNIDEFEKIKNDNQTINEEHYSDDESFEVEGCIFPMKQVEYRVWDLKHHSKKLRRKNLKYLNKNKLKSLKQYNFLDKNQLIFKQATAYVLFSNLKNISSILESKKKILTDRYVYSNYLWKKDVAFYEKQLAKVYESGKENKAKIEEPKTNKPTTSRRSRHHGDSVRTEAEFMEILASLEQERERDPLVRAQYGAAIIPDQIMDPVEKFAKMRMMDSNNLVKDKNEWAKHMYTDIIDNFTPAEHSKFCELYLLHPKKFGRISHDMGGLRTAEECVLHYYKTKKTTTNYKIMIQNKNKKSKRKNLKKKKESKSRAETTTPDTSAIENETATPVATNNNNDDDDDNDINTSTTETAIATVTETAPNSASETPMITAPLNDSTELETANIVSNKRMADTPIEKPIKLRKISDEIKVVPSKEETVINNEINIPKSDIKPIDTGSIEPQQDVLTIYQQYPDSDDQKRRKHISSYWSVHDINNFPILLQKFGSNWDEIAKELGTKSAAMVRNFYQRGLLTHPEWPEYIKNANNLIESAEIFPISKNQQIPQPVVLGMSEQQNGPLMGYFNKPSNEFTTLPNIPVAPSYHQQQQPNILNSNSPPLSNNLVPLQLGPSLPPPPPLRNNIMNMNSLLNTSNRMLGPSNIDKLPISQTSMLPPVVSHSQFSNRRPSIMNLLNSDTNNEFKDKNVYTPFKPNIRNIMNSPIKNELSDRLPDNVNFQTQPSQFTPGPTVIQTPSSIQPPQIAVQTFQPFNSIQNSQQTQLPFTQLEPHNKPTLPPTQQQNENSKNKNIGTFLGGTSALDALARVAFDQK